MGDLRIRVISALVLAPLVLAALYFGSPYTEALVILAGALMAREWSLMCSDGVLERSGIAAMTTVVLALTAGALGGYVLAGWIVAAGAMAVAVMARQGASGWQGLGVVAVAVPCLCFIWLRQLPEFGQQLVFWMLFAVWATDIGAYIAGRSLGGPKLAPVISPKKTWSGLAGGALCAAVVGGLFAYASGLHAVLPLAGLSALLALVAQTGDLLESGVKRHFGVKDAGNLIPGHGGLLDRVDGLLAASVAVAVLVWWQRGSP